MKLLFLLLLSGCAVEPPSACYSVASSSQVPHKFESMGCANYARAVAPRLIAAGARRVHRLEFIWSSPTGSNLHTVVAYTDSVGDWICDNESSHPQRTQGQTMNERCDSFARAVGSDAQLVVTSDTRIK